MNLLDPPPPAATEAAETTLAALGAINQDGTITARGQVIADLGLDPRLGRALLDGASEVGHARAAEVVAMLDQDVPAPGGDLTALLRDLRNGRDQGASRAWQRRRRQVLQTLGAARDAKGDSPTGEASSSAASDGGAMGMPLDLATGLITALAHPDRIARLRPGGSTYLMAGGTGARLAPGSALAGAPWLAVAEVTRSPGQADAIIRAAAPIDADTALVAGAAMASEEDTVQWRDGRIHARRITALGAIELSTDPLPDPGPELVVRAIRDGLADRGLGILPWPAGAVNLRQRLAFLHAVLGLPWPDVSDEALLAGLGSWLGPDLDRVRATADLRRVDTTGALRRLLPWPEAAELDRLAPERIEVPSGSRIAVDYSDPQRPVLAVRIQEVFGWEQVPRLGRVFQP